MADIFLAYSHHDRERVEPIVHALEGHGWTISWDSTLRPAERWDKKLRRAIEDARCVIVVWTRSSAMSDNVADEASYAYERRKLLPVLLDPDSMPYPYHLMHAINLVGWRGGEDSDVLRTLITEVRGMLEDSEALREQSGESSNVRPGERSQISAPRTRRKKVRRDVRRTFNGVDKDPIDLRDLVYEVSDSQLPLRIDNRLHVPIVLDQGQEGRCIGFALAAVVNFLQFNRLYLPSAQRRRLRQLEHTASARMLDEMCRRYDDRQDVIMSGGPSVRAALKGWMRHGVCRWSDWPSDQMEPDRLTQERQLAALKQPLGAYYRVRHLYLTQMHSALNEYGILFASAAAHEGWQQVGREGLIPFSRNIVGAHAFAIVGYDEYGFWIQNSWGPDWGLNGFGRIGYGDWLENCFDCWVASLGVPIAGLSGNETSVYGRAAEFGYVPSEAIVLGNIRPHIINLADSGDLRRSGIYNSDETEVNEVVIGGFKDVAEKWRGPRRIVICCHGGIESEKATAARVASHFPTFLANQIYPVHFMWQAGFREIVGDIVEGAFRRPRFLGWDQSLRERFYDLLDEGVELGSRGLGIRVWNDLKESAARATDAGGGARFAIQEIKRCFDSLDQKPEVHLLGHGVGSILTTHLVPLLAHLNLPMKSLTFFAPACTLDVFDERISNYLGRNVERFALFNLSDECERGDNVGTAYRKSLLYLISKAFEIRARGSLLGMEAFVNPPRHVREAMSRDECKQVARIKKILGLPLGESGNTVIRGFNLPASIVLSSESATHSGFGTDEATLNSTLRIIIGKQMLAKQF